MVANRTATRSNARERARQRRLQLDAERAQRDEQIETAAATFYESSDTCEDLRAQIARAETAMGNAIQHLIDLKETPQRIQALLDIDSSEFKRLKPARAPRLSAVPNAADPAPAGDELDQAAAS